MILYINTADNIYLEVGLKKDGRFAVREKIKAERAQAEELLPAIEKMLKKQKISLSGLRGIEVNNQGGGFTSLRIGVASANALGFALGIPVRTGAFPDDFPGSEAGAGFSAVKPLYGREPDIT